MQTQWVKMKNKGVKTQYEQGEIQNEQGKRQYQKGKTQNQQGKAHQRAEKSHLDLGTTEKIFTFVSEDFFGNNLLNRLRFLIVKNFHNEKDTFLDVIAQLLGECPARV